MTPVMKVWEDGTVTKEPWPELEPAEGDTDWYESLSADDRALVERLDRYNDNRNRTVATRMAWPELVKAEPRLAELERDLAAMKDDGGPTYCANARWFGYGDGFSYRRALCSLVGWTAENPALRTRAAYDLAYKYLYDLLPGCRGCMCP